MKLPRVLSRVVDLACPPGGRLDLPERAGGRVGGDPRLLGQPTAGGFGSVRVSVTMAAPPGRRRSFRARTATMRYPSRNGPPLEDIDAGDVVTVILRTVG